MIWPRSRFPVRTTVRFPSDLDIHQIVDQRWYMFQNMGPSPSGRSGHAMATAGQKVFVLGGESFSPSKADDPSFTHVLDTSACLLLEQVSTLTDELTFSS